jgi:hypothetical protein
MFNLFNQLILLIAGLSQQRRITSDHDYQSLPMGSGNLDKLRHENYLYVGRDHAFPNPNKKDVFAILP